MNKIKLSRYQNMILRTLEEAEAEDLSVIINTLYCEFKYMDTPVFLEVVRFELHILIKINYLYLIMDDKGSVALQYFNPIKDKHTIEEILNLNNTFSWDNHQKLFRWNSPWANDNRVQIVLTETGKIALTR